MRRARFFYSIVLGEFDGNLHAKRHDSYLYVVDRFSDAAGIVFSIYTQAGVGVELDAITSVVIGGTLLSGGVGTVLGTLFGVAIQGLIQTYINFDGTLSSWWTKIAIGVLLFIFIALQRGLTVLWEHRQSSPVRRITDNS